MNREIKELDYRSLLYIRQQRKEDHIRYYKVLNINFNATDFVEIIAWQFYKLIESPLLATLSDEDLPNMVQNPTIKEIAKYHCHTQAVKRSIKLVTEASMAVCGETNRDGFI
ncbi:hypothetical protein ILUMI_13268 [Ignelater luminosus]|uniref:Uncharacterized protein n=1 Tax=Ignelater luminosus TaxID=2038154 RepID=A0A8K0GBK7_IGNLU|nr:hypothetical protein ILUMI_13268 [Ignelater luminosus]